MVARTNPRRLTDVLREIDADAASGLARSDAASDKAQVQRRGRDAVLEAADVDIIVYEHFKDRA